MSAWPTVNAVGRNSRSGTASTSCSPPRPRTRSTTRTPTTSSRRSSQPKAAAAAAPEAELRELGTLEQHEPRESDEAARDELTRRGRAYVQADVDAWLARPLAAHLGHYRDPAAREAAAGPLPQPVLAHAALLAELSRLVPSARVDQLAFAARLAAADPEATADLTAFLTRATELADAEGSPA